ncbi:hypothetical protein ACQP1W_44925 [Spirillospora sp. CA-255316]
MKLLSFTHAGRESWGLLEGAEVLDLGARPAFEAPTLVQALRGDDLMGIAMNAVGLAPDYRLDDVDLLPPIPRPARIIRVDGDTRKPAQAANSASTQSSWRPGVAAVVGYRCGRVPPAHAPEMIAGYSCFAEGSATSWGPYLVTPDEFRETAKGDLTVRIDGRTVLRPPVLPLAGLLHELLSRESFSTILEPGDVLAVLVPRPATDCGRSPAAEGRCEVTMPAAGVLRHGLPSCTMSTAQGKPVGW